MRIIFLLVMLLIGLAQAATTSTTVTDSYQLIGSGPMLVTTKSQSKPIRIYIGTSSPANNTEAYHLEQSAFSYPGNESVFIRSEKNTSTIVITPVQ